MNYIYDIILNFQERIYDFYEWNKTDVITHIRKIPVFKISSKDLYNIGNVVTLSASNGGGLIGYWTQGKSWTNYYWLDSTSSHIYGNISSTDALLGSATSAQIKALVSNGSLPSTNWATTSTINSGYPHLKVFDDTSIWLRDSNINGGDPYLKDNPHQE